MSLEEQLPRLHVIRHGETVWSLAGLHTGRTDLPLTPRGEQAARRLAGRLDGIKFTSVLTSPRLRARRTCEFAGLGADAEIEPDLREWDYGDYEGRTTAEILAKHEGWNLFFDGCPGGESPAQVAARADALVDRLRLRRGNVALFSHGHFLRVLAARWVGLPVSAAQHLALGTASLGVLDHEHHRRDNPVIALWNETAAPETPGAKD